MIKKRFASLIIFKWKKYKPCKYFLREDFKEKLKIFVLTSTGQKIIKNLLRQVLAMLTPAWHEFRFIMAVKRDYLPGCSTNQV